MNNSIKDAADFLNDITRVSNMSKVNCEIADQHAQALYATLAHQPVTAGLVKEVVEPDNQPIDRMKFPYQWEGERPPENIIRQVINKYMGEKDREYDNDQFKYYLNNWHGHAELNRRMREAFPLAALKTEGRNDVL